MIVLFDTDVILDLLLDREPFADATARMFSKVEKGDITGYVCATTVTTIHYLASKAAGAGKSRKSIQRLISLLEVAPVNRAVLEGALEGKYDDFEDGVVAEAAHHVGAKAIVTRNVRHYRNSTVPAYLPGEILEMIMAGEGTA
ncbi:MAG: PIN domain-containing protein [Proteobacteria bacterium]|nr:PIN domain-containing protein [Pseudomonadota bacterium]